MKLLKLSGLATVFTFLMSAQVEANDKKEFVCTAELESVEVVRGVKSVRPIQVKIEGLRTADYRISGAVYVEVLGLDSGPVISSIRIPQGSMSKSSLSIKGNTLKYGLRVDLRYFSGIRDQDRTSIEIEVKDSNGVTKASNRSVSQPGKRLPVECKL